MAKETKQAMSIADLINVTGASHMTVYNWREGRTGGRPKLPCSKKVVGARHRVEIKGQVFKAWADKHGIEYNSKKLAAFL